MSIDRRNRYRIVNARFWGFAVQVNYWWLPGWWRVGGSNSHASLDLSEEFAKRHAGGTVKYLGRLP